MDQVNINESVSISSLISRIETNKSFYGRFEIGPFAHGQGITVANMLRRTLLSELSGLAITAVEIQEASHEYMTLPGMNESVQDVILNLKQLIFRSDFNLRQPEFGFLCMRGPAVVKASNLRLPSFIKCVDPDQYIATLAFNGQLNLKIQICQGKNYKFQTPLDINWPGSGVLSSTHSSQAFEKPQKSSYFSKNATTEITNNNTLVNNQSISQQDFRFTSQSEYIQQKSEYFSKFSNPQIFNKNKNSALLKSKLKNIPGEPFKKESENLLREEKNQPILTKEASLKQSPVLLRTQNFIKQTNQSNDVSTNLPELINPSSSSTNNFQVKKQIGKNESNTRNIIYKSSKNPELIESDSKLEGFNLEYSSKQKLPSIKEIENRLLKTDNILPVDAIFTPVTKVNYLISLDEKVKPFTEQVLLEVWTNGSITPKTAVYKAAEYLLELILPLSKSAFD